MSDIAVLLPVRIETRFKPGRLLVRVVPDEPWFARHDPRVSPGELEALERYLTGQAVREQAWRELVGQVGGARAVYLVRNFVVLGAVRPVAPDELREEPRLPTIEGFPQQLGVWLARAGGAPVLALTLNVDRGRLLADFPDLDLAERRWWEDWNEAVSVGLAGEIPLTGNPGNIDALFVTGLGDGDPATLFASHRDEGRLATLSPGTPTNSVDGTPAAPLADDPDTWWEVLQTAASAQDRLVSLSLTGEQDLLGNLPGPSEPQRAQGSAMVKGLWPALWGFAGQDVWGMPGDTRAAASWAATALFPEGPLPAVRVGSQPYGLLPVTALDHWQAAPGDPPVEESMRQALLELRESYRAAAESRGTVVGATGDKLLDLIGHVPTSPLFRHRRAWPLQLWWLTLLLLAFGVRWPDLDLAWRNRYGTADRLGLTPARRYGTVAAARRLEIPLVTPTSGAGHSDVLRELVRLAKENPAAFARTSDLERDHLGFPPDSLLLRLAVRSLQVAIGDIGRMLLQEPPPRLDDLARDTTTPSRLETWIAATSPGDLREKHPFTAVVDGLLAVADLAEDRAERLLRATVDTASFRLDPWLTGPATRRLNSLLETGAPKLRLGAYGWVDRPRPGGAGPTAGGLLHAPSQGQVRTATVLRDRAVNDSSDTRWDLDLTSRTVRDADRMAEHVRVGSHLAEALGREIERIVADPADVARLRRDFPVKVEHAGRRVCDGLAILAAAPSALGLDPVRLAALERLRAATEAYGDLLVAEAVHHVTQGRAETAGAVMDAAAGLSRPPRLDLLRTPREGRAVTSSTVVALRDVPPPPQPSSALEQAELPPTALADPSVAAFVAEQTGDAATWTFEIVQAGGPGVTVTLQDLGVRPADALALSVTDLQHLAVQAGADSLGVDPATVALAGGGGLARYERAVRLVSMVGRNVAGPDAVIESSDAAVGQAAVDADLLARYTRVRDTAATLAQVLAGQLAQTSPDGGLGTADRGVLTRLVVAARSWGVAPAPAAESQDADHRLVAVATRVASLIEGRVAAAPAGQALSRDDLVAALAALLSPTGQVALTGRLVVPSLQVDALLDREWLPVVAAVRAPLARLEAHQLAAGTRLTAWSNKPGDPWQRQLEAERLVIAYAPQGVDLGAGGSAAVAVLDSFSEVVPASEQTTGAAFGFNAPAARAPQAILLAVPPDLSKPIDGRTVLDIVAEARLLARVRMARPADLDRDLRGLLPAALLPATGATAVPLEPTRS
ncbi:hypothetical protein [Streptosporangium roseum]|uniref:hypothetical protein n=1 Tax=Streptosporangium roseum TaxID=2001 RepID=UPI00331802B9